MILISSSRLKYKSFTVTVVTFVMMKEGFVWDRVTGTANPRFDVQKFCVVVC